VTKIDELIQRYGWTANDVNSLARVETWPVLSPEAHYGLAGRIVATIQPYSEADPAATLVHVLVGFGNLIGPGPHARVQEDTHPCRLNAILVGATSKGRKGTAWSTPRAMLGEIDPEYVARRVATGLSSGEGLIFNVRDPRIERQPVKEKGRIVDYEAVAVDEGEPDKRLLIIEPELASVLRRMNGETNTLSALVRQAWDSGRLATLTKNNPLRATNAHISIVGHITKDELTVELADTDRANGFANRFLFVLVKRSQLLPEGGRVPADLMMPLVRELSRAFSFAGTVAEMPRDEEAKGLWAEIYPLLSRETPGMFGAIISRAEAQVLRLSLLYAVLDCSSVVRAAHLKGALAVWQYAEDSARCIFGDRLGVSLADTIIEALRGRGSMTRTDISGLFARNRSSRELEAALSHLERHGLAKRVPQISDAQGRPAEVWAAV
jgi:Protein of unknown function (DUF3987)